MDCHHFEGGKFCSFRIFYTFIILKAHTVYIRQSTRAHGIYIMYFILIISLSTALLSSSSTSCIGVVATAGEVVKDEKFLRRQEVISLQWL